MKLFFEEQGTSGLFRISLADASLKGEGTGQDGTLSTIVCNRHAEQTVVIDEVPYRFPKDSILPLVANQHFIFEHPEDLLAWQFNRDFYCIADHDAEVGCVGFLFYGIHHPFFIRLTPPEVDQINALEEMCIAEMGIRDRMQGEMLRILLKRLIINVTRLAKTQTDTPKDAEGKLDIVRMFNLLLEQHFREQHEVNFYAAALHRSPKTLTNVFARFKYPSPSTLIHRRIIQEAKRYLFYTDKSAKEIAYLLGFASPAHFSRYFKQHTGKNATNYKTDKREGIFVIAAKDTPG
ncbi:MAG TPA: helix-turn-helix domain-containing protein [Puia sp.]|nr:helix-turn-helix domain-containing protein [Puia sp.]